MRTRISTESVTARGAASADAPGSAKKHKDDDKSGCPLQDRHAHRDRLLPSPHERPQEHNRLCIPIEPLVKHSSWSVPPWPGHRSQDLRFSGSMTKKSSGAARSSLKRGTGCWAARLVGKKGEGDGGEMRHLALTRGTELRCSVARACLQRSYAWAVFLNPGPAPGCREAHAFFLSRPRVQALRGRPISCRERATVRSSTLARGLRGTRQYQWSWEFGQHGGEEPACGSSCHRARA